MKSKAITLVPSVEVSDKIDRLAKLLRTSRAGFCNIAVEFVLPRIEASQMAVVNGRLQFLPEEVTND